MQHNPTRLPGSVSSVASDVENASDDALDSSSMSAVERSSAATASAWVTDHHSIEAAASQSMAAESLSMMGHMQAEILRLSHVSEEMRTSLEHCRACEQAMELHIMHHCKAKCSSSRSDQAPLWSNKIIQYNGYSVLLRAFLITSSSPSTAKHGSAWSTYVTLWSRALRLSTTTACGCDCHCAAAGGSGWQPCSGGCDEASSVEYFFCPKHRWWSDVCSDQHVAFAEQWFAFQKLG